MIPGSETSPNLDIPHTIRLAQRGDSSALALLLREHYAFVYKYLLKITLHPQTAEDVTQETMLKCVEKIRLYTFKSKFSSWLITIATNLYTDLLRRQKRERDWREQEAATMRKVVWQSQFGADGLTEITEAFGTLTHEMRVPIILKHVYGYAYEEIARMTDVPLGTVKSRIHNGLRQMRKELREDDDGQ
ncbi:RNA polymerase sigma factor SigY [Paenibacillus sp. HJGM_3]|uniref:RNA polymerase sigma factor SigY n=1 Tax=Paenibacillus sp. HJGM_3 TaxID=3379816 RepID=UPI0038590220